MKKQILLVEDDVASRELLSEWLTREGYDALASSNLASARAILLRAAPDAVLLDVGLGAESGLDLASWMRKRVELARVPVIAVTAHAMVTDRDFIFKAGCNDCVSKPVDFSQLRSCLARWLNPADLAPV
jgi:DNA-binding response OmpR family regulator